MKYGFISPRIVLGGKKAHFVLGALPKEVLQEDGDWSAYLPSVETQNKYGFDTYNCTAFATLNCIEMLIKRKFGREENYSDRFLGIMAGTYPPGNDPHIVAETIRKVGLVLEGYLPYNEFITSVSDYYSKGEAEKLLEVAKEFFKKYAFGHEWVFTSSTANHKQVLMSEALKYSPLGVSVDAWHKKGGFYVKKKGAPDNHWTACFKERRKKYWEIFDSDDKTEPKKKLTYDYDFGYVKRYWIEEKDKVEVIKRSILTELFEAAKSVIPFLKELVLRKSVGSTLPPMGYISALLSKLQASLISLLKTMPSNTELIYQTAKASLGTEASPDDKAPDELGCAETADEIVKRATGKYVNGTKNTVTISTAEMYKILSRNPEWEEIYLPERGALIISPTVGKNVGHVGICGIYGIMSNNSPTGTFEQNFTYDGWDRYYRIRKKLNVHYFKRK